jgi:phosphoglycerate dehydrogenase-like enzyme
MADIVITEFMDEAAVGRLVQAYDTLYDPKLVDDPAALHDQLTSARALIVRNRTQVRETLLSMGPKLRVIGRLGVGLDNIDVAACKARSISVIPATGANDLSVAEYVITSALMLLRGAFSVHVGCCCGRLAPAVDDGARTGGQDHRSHRLWLDCPRSGVAGPHDGHADRRL